MKVAELQNGDEGLWTAERVAKLLGVSKAWVYGQAARGKLPSVKLGGNRRFDPDVIRKLKARASAE